MWAVMAAYRIHFVTHGGRIYSAHDLVAGSEREAIEAAHRHYGNSQIGHGFEIWSDDRLVHRHEFQGMK